MKRTTPDMGVAGAAPRLSAVVPIYNVAEYLPVFLRSVDAQEVLPSELILVDDGSTDSSPKLIDEWVRNYPAPVQVVRTENRGASAARNTGLERATGDWVSFLDPDDVIAPKYFRELVGFIRERPDVDLCATALHRIADPNPRFVNNHPLRFRFAGGNHVAKLGGDLFVLNAASVAFPVAPLRETGARFPTGLHASEDALFVAKYLLSLGRTPRAGFVADAHYGYRKRAARTSAVDRYRSDPSSYIVRFRDGYLPLLTASKRGDRSVPGWLQSMLIYEMQWLLPAQMNPGRFATSLTRAEEDEVRDVLAQCLAFVDDDNLLRYDATALPLESRLLILALSGRPLWEWVGAYAKTPRGWRRPTDVVSFSCATGDAVTAVDDGATRWCPHYFAQRSLESRRQRLPGGAAAVVIDGETTSVVWPRPGETIVQSQDRHRRQILQQKDAFIPRASVMSMYAGSALFRAPVTGAAFAANVAARLCSHARRSSVGCFMLPVDTWSSTTRTTPVMWQQPCVVSLPATALLRW